MEILSAWTKEETLWLIEEFKKHPILYNAQHPEYLIVNKKREAMRSIADKVKKFKPNVDEKGIKIKLKTLKQQLNKEKKKILYSKKSGASSSAIYKPTLWCYDALSFLLHANDEYGGVSNISEIVTYSIDEEKEDFARVESQPVMHEKQRKSKKERNFERFAKTADRSLQLMERMTANVQPTKEDVFCQYLCTELKSFKLEESFDSVQLAVVTSLQAAKAKERAFFRKNEMSRRRSSPTPSPSTLFDSSSRALNN